MKIIMLCVMLIGLDTAIADTNTQKANPDQIRVAGSALILKSDKVIDVESIPSNAISGPEVVAPKNRIITGTTTIIDNPKKD